MMSETPSKSKRGKKTTFVLMLLILMIVVLEMFSYLMLYAMEKKAVSLKDIRAQKESVLDYETDAFTLANRVHPNRHPKFARRSVIHPYYGFWTDFRPRKAKIENNFPRLESWHDNPFELKEKRSKLQTDGSSESYYIGITGGSVALLFYRNGQQVLMEELQKCDFFRDRNIVFVSMAIPGFKQPQQLMSLNYFLSMGGHLDMLVNLDGFNEISLSIIENIPRDINPFYPRSWYYLTQGLADRDALSGAGAMLNILERVQKLTRLASTSPMRHSYTVALSWKLYVNFSGNKILGIQDKLFQSYSGANTTHVLTPETCQIVADNLADDLHKVWQTCSIQMDVICRGNGIKYYHFLQPNQYFPGAKPFSEEERQLGTSDYYEILVTSLYPGLIERGRELTASGIMFHDMTMVFSEINETLFTDECCHFNETGNEILAEAIGKVIARNNCP